MNRRTLTRFQKLCTRGLPAPRAVVALLDELHQLLPSEFNRFGFADDERIVAAYCEHPGCYVHLEYYFRELDGKVEYWPSVADCLRRGAGVGYYLPYQTSSFFSSAYYNEIERPLGSHYQLDAVIGDGSRVYGSMILSRRAGREFETQDVQLLGQLLPWLAHALAAAPDDAPPGGDVWPMPESGVLLFDERGAMAHADTIALRLLSLLADGRIRGYLDDGVRLVRSLIKRLDAIDRGLETSPPSCEARNRWGHFRLHARRMRGSSAEPSLVQVRIDYHMPTTLALRRLLAERQIPPRLQDVCAGLLAGRSQPAIALELDLGVATINEYVQQIYASFGVNDRLSLFRALLGTPLPDRTSCRSVRRGRQRH